MPQPNQYSGFTRTGVGITISNKGIERLAVKFGAEVSRADIPIRTAWLELASEIHARAGKILRQEVKAHGRPQRDQRGERQQLQYLLDNEPTENLATIRLHGFQFPNVAAMNASPAGRYWRQVEDPDGRTFTMSGLFVLPPIGGGATFDPKQFERPNGDSGSRDAVKFLQFGSPRAATITAHLGPKSGGYHFFKRAGDDAQAEWRKGRAKAVFIREFRAQGLDIIARILARRAFDAARGTSFEQPRFFSE